MKTLLLTGGTGFLGSHIIEDMRKMYRIITLKRSSSDISKIESFIPEIEVVDVEDIEKVFLENKIDIIVHAATDYGRNHVFLSDIIEANLALPMRLIDLGLKHGSEAFLNTDTFWDENMELPIGLKYYTLTKKDLLKYAHLAISESKTMRFLNLKIEHLYGPRDDKKKFLPYIISSFLENVVSIQLTLGEQRRDFIYVKDAVEAYRCIIEGLGDDHPLIQDYDIGSGEVHTIRHIVEKAKILLSSDSELLFGALEYRKGESMEAKADIAKLIALGWSPRYSLDDGLRATIDSMQK